MLKRIQNYLLGLFIFLLYPCGLVIFVFFLLKEVTNNLDRNITGSEILLALFILLATAILLPLGAIYIVRKLRENGKPEIVHGMFLGLVLMVAVSLIKGEIQEREEKKLLKESAAQVKAGNEAHEKLEKELAETRKQLTKEAEANAPE